MPTYDYECDACGHTFELYQGINAAVETKCPECKKKKLRRLIGTGAAVVFKGSGFYQTDYRSEGYKKAAQSESKPSDKTSGGDGKTSSGESKGESKSEAKKEAAPASSESSSPPASDSSSPAKGKKKSKD